MLTNGILHDEPRALKLIGLLEAWEEMKFL